MANEFSRCMEQRVCMSLNKRF